MNRFSSEYLYIFQNSFIDDFWIALLSSSISLFSLLIALIALCGIIFLILMLKFDRSEGRGRYKLAQGTGLIIICLLPVLVICFLSSFVFLPQMSYVKFKKEHANKIYEFYYKDKVEEYKEYPHYTASRLEDGVVHRNEAWVVNGKYKELETALYKKFPDAQNNVIYHPDVYKILNKDFMKCFDNGEIRKFRESTTIEEMQYDIGLNEEKCLNQAATQLINEINLLKQQTNNTKQK